MYFFDFDKVLVSSRPIDRPNKTAGAAGSFNSTAMLRTLALCALVATVAGVSLTKDNYDELTAGKVAFIKFQAPWYAHLIRPCRLVAHWSVCTLVTTRRHESHKHELTHK